MPVFVGHIGVTRRVEIKGDTLKEAMKNAGYIPMNLITSCGSLIGKLSTGQRFSFRLAPQARSFKKPHSFDKRNYYDD